MKKSLVLMVVAFCLLAGCEPVRHYNRIRAVGFTGEPVEVPTSKQGKIKPYGSVKLFGSKAEVTERYRVIAIMSVSGDPGDEADFIKAFLYRAADMDADAVVLDRSNSQAGGVAGGLFATAVSSYRAEAVKFEHDNK